MNPARQKLFGLFILTGLIGFGIGWQALAAEPQNNLGLTVSPPSLELSANPGDTLNEVVRITNESPNAVTFEVSAEDFKVEGTEGSVVVEEDKDPNAFSRWISFPVTQFRLAPKESTQVAFKIAVPRNAAPGGHFVSVLFNPKATDENTGTGAKVIQRVGSLLLMRVSGAVVEEGNIKRLSTKSFVGEWNEVTGSDGRTKILVAKEEKLTEERPRKWFEKGPVAFDLVFQNTGNVHFRPAGTLTIYNLFGRKVGESAIDPRNVFPGGDRRVTVIWPEQSLKGLFYRAQVAAVYGSQNKVITAETHFWGFPSGILIAIVVALVLLLLLRRRLLRALSVLIKGR